MKKLLITLLCLLMLCGCAAKNNDNNTSRKEIEVLLPNGDVAVGEGLPDSIADESVTVESQKPTVDYYVGSTSTNKFHLKDCTWAEKIKDENRIYLSGYNEFIEKGFVPCKSCNP